MTKNILITVAVAFVVSLGVVSFMGITKSDTFGSVRQVADEFVQGLRLGQSPNTLINSFTLTLKARDNQETWRNTTGGTVYVFLANVTTAGTASSSMALFMGTSSVATLTSDFTDPFSSIIDNVYVSTSTTATTTSSIARHNTASSDGAIPVADGEYVFLQMQSLYSCTTVGVCETATSSNRGITTVKAKVFYHD